VPGLVQRVLAPIAHVLSDPELAHG
jgi:hypothetical protein